MNKFQTEFNEDDTPIAALKQSARKILTDSILKMLFNEEEITEMLFADVMNGISSRYDKLIRRNEKNLELA